MSAAAGPPPAVPIDALRGWIGRTQTAAAVLDAAPLRLRAAMLDRDEPALEDGTPLPLLAHWLYALPYERHGRLGEDGHAERGDFLPPVPLPRRMWAGSRIEFMRPLRVGERIVRRSRIAEVSVKQGRSGRLVFVSVEHAIEVEGDARGPALVDRQELVFRDRPGAQAEADAPAAEPLPEGVRLSMRVDAALLFRFSALTFNAHRIHYDRPYAQQAEGYPGLVVHGPLVMTLLADLLQREHPGAQPRSLAFSVRRPLFDTAPFTLHVLPAAAGEGARRVDLQARDPQGRIAVEGHALLD